MNVEVLQNDSVCATGLVVYAIPSSKKVIETVYKMKSEDIEKYIP